MGIKGIYKEIGPGKRVSMCKLAVDHLEATGRPLRVAIDVSIWQFQVQAARGGANPAIRTLFYRLVRLLSLSIQPLFVFDGPNKPLFKRHKRSTGRPGDTVATASCRRLIRLFGFDAHDAPGEAEAECALLQRQGVVDAVLSEDVDTIMFGCTRTLRNWSAIDNAAGNKSATSSKPPTHITVYDAAELEGGLEREGMVLVALMSGGDYIPEGIPGAGVKVACEAARGGFGKSLCRLKRADAAGLSAWRDNLCQELKNNESGFFRTKHKALAIPEDFPNMDVLRYYTHPVVSQAANVEKLRAAFPSRRTVDVEGLREFGREIFDWSGKIGAIKFIRVIAPGLLVQKMLAVDPEDGMVNGISLRRSHASTDSTPELRVSYTPADIVGLDLNKEPEEVVEDATYGRDGLALNSDDDFEGTPDPEEVAKGAKKPFDPLQPDMVWVPESIVSRGAPIAIQDWMNKKQAKEQRLAAKAAAPKKRVVRKTGMPAGALDKYVKTTKNITITMTAKSPSPSRSPVRAGSPPHPILLASLSQPPQRLSPSLARMSTESAPPASQPQIKAPAAAPTRSKRAPRKPKADATAAVAADAQKNPWTIASSQNSGSPSVSRVTKKADATSPPPRFRLEEHEAILLESSPIGEDAALSAAIAASLKDMKSTTPDEKKHGRVTPPPENSFEEDPFASSPIASPRKHRSPVIEKDRTSKGTSSQPPPSMSLKEPAATSRRATSKKPLLANSTQQSIKTFGTTRKEAVLSSSRARVNKSYEDRDPFASSDEEHDSSFEFPSLADIGKPKSRAVQTLKHENTQSFEANGGSDTAVTSKAERTPPEHAGLPKIMSTIRDTEDDVFGQKASGWRKDVARWRLSDMSVVDLTGDD